MSDFRILQDLITSAQNKRSDVQIHELDNDGSNAGSESEKVQKKPDKTRASSSLNDQTTDFEKDRLDQDDTQESEPENSENTDDTGQRDDDDQHNFMMDVEEAKLEQIGTLLSAFFQDDRGFNVVDAIVQNSKVQNRIAKTLERICDRLDRGK